jgi:histidine triad (HIT) family protein
MDDCLFCKIVRKEIPAKVIYETDELLAFEDINPRAPIHILIIPKKHLATINDATEEDCQVLGNIILSAKKIAANLGISDDGYRLVYNVNQHGGQEVYHIHLHLLGGRKLTWPPG